MVRMPICDFHSPVPMISSRYGFDFAAWLAPLDRIANATVLPDAALALGTVAFTVRLVAVRLGPAAAPGAYVIGCAVVTPQGREKSVSATVMLQ